MLAFLEWKSGERKSGQLDHNPNIFFLSRWSVLYFRTLSAVVRSCHAHTRFTESALLLWYRTACKYAWNMVISIFGNKLKYGRTLHCFAENLLVFNSALGVCVWTCSSYESTMNSFQLHVKFKNLSPLKEPWSPVGKSDLLTNSDWFLRLKN